MKTITSPLLPATYYEVWISADRTNWRRATAGPSAAVTQRQELGYRRKGLHTLVIQARRKLHRRGRPLAKTLTIARQIAANEYATAS